MKVARPVSWRTQLAARLARARAFRAIRLRRNSIAAIVLTVALWASAVIAIAEYWRAEVPVVRAVGARATAHRVLDVR